MDPAEVRAVAELAVERGIYLIGDETYEHFLYGDATHVVPAALDPEVKRWTIEVNTVSKTYAMTGWRVGYAAGPEEVIGAMAALMGQSTTQTASVSQWTAVEALTGPQDCIQEMVGEFTKRREYFITGLHRIGIECAWPEGAFYAYPRLPAGEVTTPDAHDGGRGGARPARQSSLDFADRLLTEGAYRHRARGRLLRRGQPTPQLCYRHGCIERGIGAAGKIPRLGAVASPPGPLSTWWRGGVCRSPKPP